MTGTLPLPKVRDGGMEQFYALPEVPDQPVAVSTKQFSHFPSFMGMVNVEPSITRISRSRRGSPADGAFVVLSMFHLVILKSVDSIARSLQVLANLFFLADGSVAPRLSIFLGASLTSVPQSFLLTSVPRKVAKGERTLTAVAHSYLVTHKLFEREPRNEVFRGFNGQPSRNISNCRQKNPDVIFGVSQSHIASTAKETSNVPGLVRMVYFQPLYGGTLSANGANSALRFEQRKVLGISNAVGSFKIAILFCKRCPLSCFMELSVVLLGVFLAVCASAFVTVASDTVRRVFIPMKIVFRECLFAPATSFDPARFWGTFYSQRAIFVLSLGAMFTNRLQAIFSRGAYPECRSGQSLLASWAEFRYLRFGVHLFAMACVRARRRMVESGRSTLSAISWNEETEAASSRTDRTFSFFGFILRSIQQTTLCCQAQLGG